MFEKKDEQTAPVSSVKLDLQSEKSHIAEDLRDASDRIDRRIRAIDEQTNDADDKLKSSLSELRAKLVREKKKVDRSLKDVEKSTKESWQVTNKKATEILTDVKIETQKIEERVEDIINN